MELGEAPCKQPSASLKPDRPPPAAPPEAARPDPARSGPGPDLGRRTPRRLRVFFLRHFRACGEVKLAAEQTGIALSTLYRWRKRDAAFREHWDGLAEQRRQMAEDRLMSFVREGEKTAVFHKGEQVGWRQSHTPRAAIAALAYFDRREKAEARAQEKAEAKAQAEAQEKAEASARERNENLEFRFPLRPPERDKRTRPIRGLVLGKAAQDRKTGKGCAGGTGGTGRGVGPRRKGRQPSRVPGRRPKGGGKPGAAKDVACERAARERMAQAG